MVCDCCLVDARFGLVLFSGCLVDLRFGGLHVFNFLILDSLVCAAGCGFGWFRVELGWRRLLVG